MLNVVWLSRHGPAPADSSLKNASIGISSPESTLSLLARPRDASLRPAQIFRRCDGEQPAASAMASTVICLECAQRRRGWIDIVSTISTRNDKSQPKKFLVEMCLCDAGELRWNMGKKSKKTPPPPRPIYLGEWLELLGIGPSEAAKLAGCTQSYISNMMRGVKPNVNVQILLRLSEKIGITINDFYQRPPSPTTADQMASYSTTTQTTLLNLHRKKI